MKRSSVALVAALALGLGLVVVFLAAAGGMASPLLAKTLASTCRVAETHPNAQDIPTCGSAGTPCETIQYAVDLAAPYDTVLVAEGVYSGVNAHAGLSQVVYISKSLTLRGGYAYTDWAVADRDLHRTIIDAEGKGRGITMQGDISVTVDGFEVTGGNAHNLGGSSAVFGDAGHGVYAFVANLSMSRCKVYENHIGGNRPGLGGGVYVRGEDDDQATLDDCDVYRNTASSVLCITCDGHGGGVGSEGATLTILDSRITSNTASTVIDGYGGGIHTVEGTLVLKDSLVQNNTASSAYDGSGGGIYLKEGSGTLDHNVILSNTATTGEAASMAQGGGVFVYNGTALTLTDNTVAHNRAGSTDSALGDGGGAYVLSMQRVLWQENTVAHNVANDRYIGYGGGAVHSEVISLTMKGNTIVSNTACTVNHGRGGGLLLSGVGARLEGNKVLGNVAATSVLSEGMGGGIYVDQNVALTMINNLVAGNWGATRADGLWFGGSGGSDSSGTLIHNTFAGNEGPAGIGEGILVEGTSELVMTDTLISDHPEVGVEVDKSATAELEATLWYGNGADTAGMGSITTGTIDLHGDPAYADPANWDYHLTLNSAAIDQGLDAGVDDDLDGVPRPARAGFDIGAYEYPYSMALTPDRTGSGLPGEVVAHAHTLSNEGTVTDTFALSAGSDQGWAMTPASPVTVGAGLTVTVVVSIPVPGDALSGTLDTTVLTATSQGDPAICGRVEDRTTVLRLVRVRLDPDGARTAAPGETVTYSHTLGNSGNWTDTVSLAASSSQGWAAVDAGPYVLAAGAEQTVVVTIAVPAAAAEGTVDTALVTATSATDPQKRALATDVTTVERVVNRAYLPVVIKNY